MRFSVRFILFAVMPYVMVLSVTWATLSMPLETFNPSGRSATLLRALVCVVITIVWTYVVAYWSWIDAWLKRRKQRKQAKKASMVSDI
jgi:hypothetical protein